MRLCWFLFGVLCLSYNSFGQHYQKSLLVSNNNDELYRVSTYIYFLEDKDGTLTISEASADSLESSYKPLDKPAVDFGLSESYYWLRLVVKRDRTDSANYVVTFHEPKTEKITFFSKEGNVIHEIDGGYKIPVSQKILNTPINIFPIPFIDGEAVLYYRLKANGTLTRVSIESYNDAENYALKRNFYSGLFGGFLIIVIIYCLNLYYSLRERLFLIYASVVFVLTVCNLSLDGSISYINELIGTNSLFLFAKFGHLANPAIQYYGILFLNLKKFAPRWLYTFHRIMLFVYLMTSILAWFIPIKAGFFSMQAHGLFLFVTLIMTSLVVSARGNRFAKYFTFGCLSYLLGIVFEVSHWQGLIPAVGYLTYVSYGQILEISILTLALNRRISFEKDQLENDKAAATRLAIENARENEKLVVQQNSMLEVKVEERTRQLNLKNEQLEQLNHLKDKFFSIISHDLRGPLKNLNNMMTMAGKDQISETETKLLLKDISKNTRNLSELLDNLLSWAKDQLQENRIHMSEFDLSSLINKNVELLRAYAKEKNIVLQHDLLDRVLVQADMNMMDFVFRNLISNAIKFTPSGGSVFINKENTSLGLKVSVTDTGIGIDSETLERLFTIDSTSTPGTANEMGVGLGLQLAKEFIERNNGRIDVISEPMKGSKFSVTIPAKYSSQ